MNTTGKTSVFTETQDAKVDRKPEVHKDANGMEYIYIDNPYDDLGLFSDKPGDALRCIKEDLGDTLNVSLAFGMHSLNVVRFLNRDYGQEKRAETLAGWKDAKFVFAVKYRSLNSIGDGYLVYKDGTLHSQIEDQDDIQTFSTVEDAEMYIAKIVAEVKQWRKEYSLIKGDKKARDEFFSRHKEAIPDVKSVYWYVFRASTEVPPDYELYVAQIVAPDTIPAEI